MRCQDEPIEIGGIHEKVPLEMVMHLLLPKLGPFPYSAVRVKINGVQVAQIGNPPG